MFYCFAILFYSTPSSVVGTVGTGHNLNISLEVQGHIFNTVFCNVFFYDAEICDIFSVKRDIIIIFCLSCKCMLDAMNKFTKK